jgi:uncharacterized protein GlcG (DUF336 family)
MRSKVWSFSGRGSFRSAALKRAMSGIALIALLAAALPAAAQASSGDVTLQQAQLAIEAAKAKAREQGTLMDIAVVDAGGNLKAFARMDGAFLGSIDISIKKARTARFLNMSTKELGDLSQVGQPLFGIEITNGGLVIFGGGELLKDKAGNIIGAIGVSGSSVENDMAVAKAGAASILAPPAIKAAPAKPLVGDIGLDQAQAIIEAAKVKAKEQGTLMDIAVVDAGGNLKAFVRMDGAFLGSIDISISKARTARYFNMSTKEFGDLSQPGQALFGIEVTNGGLVIFGGGELLKDKAGNIIGAVGVSGSSVENDIGVAKAGVGSI